MVWFCMVLYDSVWFGMVWYGLVWFGMVWYGLVWLGLAWYGFFTTSPAGRLAGRAVGRLDPSENKANSVQNQLNLPVGTELGNNKLTN